MGEDVDGVCEGVLDGSDVVGGAVANVGEFVNGVGDCVAAVGGALVAPLHGASLDEQSSCLKTMALGQQSSDPPHSP